MRIAAMAVFGGVASYGIYYAVSLAYMALR